MQPSDERSNADPSQSDGDSSNATQDLFLRLAGQLDLVRISELIAEAVERVTQAKLTSVLLVNREAETMKIVAATGLAVPHRGLELKFTGGIGLVAYSRKTRKTLLVPDVHASGEEWDGWYFPIVESVQSELCVPVMLEGSARVLGVIAAESVDPAHFTVEHQRIIEGWAYYLANSIRAAESYRRLKALSEQSKGLAQTRDLDEGLRALLELAVRHTGAKSGTIRLLESATGTLTLRVRVGESAEGWDDPIEVGSGVVGLVFAEGSFRLVLNVAALGPGEYRSANPKTQSELAVCIEDNVDRHGVLNLEHDESGNFDTDDLSFVIAVAGLAALLLSSEKRRNAEQLSGQREATVILAQHLTHEVMSNLTVLTNGIEHARHVIELGDVPAGLLKLEGVWQLSYHTTERVEKMLASVRFKMNRLDLNKIARERVQELEPQRPSRVKMKLTEATSPLWVLADSNAISLIIDTLVANAYEATERLPGRHRVRVELTRIDAHAQIQVIDDGPGIDMDTQAQLKEQEFVTTKKTKDHPYRGTGLRLSGRLCTLMGGALTFESWLATGSVFTVRLPLVQGDSSGSVEGVRSLDIAAS